MWDTADNSRSSGLVFADVDCLGPAASDEGFNPGQDCTADTKRRVKAVKKNGMVGQRYQKQLTCLVDLAVSPGPGWPLSAVCRMSDTILRTAVSDFQYCDAFCRRIAILGVVDGCQKSC